MNADRNHLLWIDGLTVCLLACALWLALCAAALPPARAATVSDAFFEAEACSKALHSSPKAMKYRHNWERCIEQFSAVYKRDVKGPWAPASLYNAGRLYEELYAYSKNDADRSAAVAQFETIKAGFPDSAYHERALAELKKITEGAPADSSTVSRQAPSKPAEPLAAAPPAPKEPPRRAAKADSDAAKPPATASTPAAKKGFTYAASCMRRLQTAKPTEKGRRDWMLCIGRYHNVYLLDPDGPYAAASLLNEGLLYQDLYKGLKFDSDQRAARESFEKILSEFPQSGEAAKASRLLQAMAPVAVPKLAVLSPPLAAGTPAPQDGKGPPPAEAGANPEDGQALVQDLQYWSNPNYTRVVVYADRETGFESRLLKKDPSLDKPPRLYVDLSNSHLSHRIQKTVPINDDLLSDARAGQYTKESVRVVVDIKSFESYKVFSLRDPFRVVIDVWGPNGAAAPQAGSERADAGSEPVQRGGGKIPPSALAKQLALGVRRIVVDPGHGGKDFGAPGFVPGVHEKDIVLQIGRRLATKIREELGCEAILTRSDDRYITLEERTAFANTRSADLFVSIHTNASRDPRAFGIETYFLNLATDDEAIRVAAMENATSTKNISDLQSILNDLMKNAKINESSRLAATVQSALMKNLDRRGYNRLRDKGVKQAPFYVLLGARMPSILVETAFISNREECNRLTSASYQEHVAESIVQGIREYIKEINPTAFTPPFRGEPG
jgi:N-acetylmuramoyl-L-alanine amidase